MQALLLTITCLRIHCGSLCFDALHPCLHTVLQCMHAHMVCAHLTGLCVQDFVLALMMGTHPRLGADSGVLLLDAYVAASIADMLMADRW